jgi:hypothetical protein
MITSLTFMITLLGSATVGLSAFVAVRFFIQHITMRGDGKRLTRALTWMVLGELVLGVGTLCFAILAHTQHLPMIPVEVQSIARLIMFGCTAASTLHLFMVISTLSDD